LKQHRKSEEGPKGRHALLALALLGLQVQVIWAPCFQPSLLSELSPFELPTACAEVLASLLEVSLCCRRRSSFFHRSATGRETGRSLDCFAMQLTLPHIRRIFSHYCESSRSTLNEEGLMHLTEKKFISLPGFLRFVADCQIAQLCDRAELVNLFRIVNEFHLVDTQITTKERATSMANQTLIKDEASGKSPVCALIPEAAESEAEPAGISDDEEGNDAAEIYDLPADFIENPDDELIESEFVQALLMLASIVYDVPDVTLAEKFFMMMARLPKPQTRARAFASHRIHADMPGVCRVSRACSGETRTAKR
jgi:hypothetical protein